MCEFEEIKITGFDDNNWMLCKEHSNMRYIPVKLSATPPRDWLKIWEQCRARFSHGMSRRTVVRNKVIYLYAGIDGIDDFEQHLAELKSRAEVTNEEYRKRLERLHKEEQAKLKQEKEKEMQDNILKEKLRSQGLIG